MLRMYPLCPNVFRSGPYDLTPREPTSVAGLQGMGRRGLLGRGGGPHSTAGPRMRGSPWALAAPGRAVDAARGCGQKRA